jgi:hypothetical protein
MLEHEEAGAEAEGSAGAASSARGGDQGQRELGEGRGS